jgi:hypothetical protein
MYLRTKEGLGQYKETWVTPQALNRVMVEPVSIGYLGNFDEHLGQTESKPCWDCYKTAPCWTRYIVRNFKPASAELTDVIKKDIEDKARAIVRILHRILKSKSAEFKKRKTSLAVMLQFEGHLSKAIDPQNKSLDLDRAKAVSEYLSTKLSNEWGRQGVGKLQNGFGYNQELSAAGSKRPISSIARKNRRVEICVQPYVPTGKGLSLLTP